MDSCDKHVINFISGFFNVPQGRINDKWVQMDSLTDKLPGEILDFWEIYDFFFFLNSEPFRKEIDNVVVCFRLDSIIAKNPNLVPERERWTWIMSTALSSWIASLSSIMGLQIYKKIYKNLFLSTTW